MNKVEIVKYILIFSWPVILLLAYMFWNKYKIEKEELIKFKESLKQPEFTVDEETKATLQRLAGVKPENKDEPNRNIEDIMFDSEIIKVVGNALETYNIFDVEATGTQIEATLDDKQNKSGIESCVVKAEYENKIMKVLTRLRFSSIDDAKTFITKFKETKQRDFAIITGEPDCKITGTEGKKYVVISETHNGSTINSVVYVSILYSVKIDKSNYSSFMTDFPRNYYDSVVKLIK